MGLSVMRSHCDEHPAGQTTLFCQECGGLLEPGSLRRVRFEGFTGPASLVPSIERFWETGDVEHFGNTPAA